MDLHTTAPGRPGLDESLTDDEYDRLEALLDLGEDEDAMDLEEMDGFFAALICGPVTVPPSVYLEEIWGEGGAPFDSMAELEDFLNLAMRHWNIIARELSSPDLVSIPWLMTEEGEELPRGNRWADGFVRGMNLGGDAWNEIFRDDDKFAMLLPVLALVHENDSDAEMRTWKIPPDAELRKQVLVGLAAAAQKLHDYFLTRRKREGSFDSRRGDRASRRIGRNDPCNCGSGKKYKRCCGAVTVQ